MSESSRELLRTTFTEVADLYDRARPTYPPELFTDLAEPGARVLEIGCGTGQATVPLAEKGCHVTAVELGSSMADVARRKLARFPHVEVVNAPFETWPLPVEPFDLVLSATAFHWIDPEVRIAKSAQALRPGGTLATIATHHVAGGTAAFFSQVQSCYKRYDPATPPNLRLSTPDQIPHDPEDLSPHFAPPTFHRHAWEVIYTTDQYLDLLRTYSNHRALPTADLAALLRCIADLINTRHNGHITKRYLAELRTARRIPVSPRER